MFHSKTCSSPPALKALYRYATDETVAEMVEELMPTANELLAACKPIPDVDKTAYKVRNTMPLFMRLTRHSQLTRPLSPPFFFPHRLSP